MSWTDSEIERLITFYSSMLVSDARNFATWVKNRRQKPTPVFWCRFLVHVSLALEMVLSRTADFVPISYGIQVTATYTQHLYAKSQLFHILQFKVMNEVDSLKLFPIGLPRVFPIGIPWCPE